MKENVKSGAVLPEISFKDLLYGIAAHAGVALLAFFMSRVAVADGLLPFGISIISACPIVLMPGAIFGTIAGYIFPISNISMFRYIAACLAVLAVRILCNGITPIAKKTWFLCGIATAACLVTGLVTLSSKQYSFYLVLAEAVLSMGGAYFVHYGFCGVRRRKGSIKHKEFCSAVIVLAITAVGVIPINIGGISLGRALCVALIISAARYGGTGGGTVTGTAVGTAAILSGGSAAVCMLYTLGGLCCGITKGAGRYFQILTFLSVTFLVGIFDISVITVGAIIESLIGCALFLLLPRNLQIKCGKLFSAGTSVVQPVSLKRALTMRLSNAANALSDVSLTVDQVARELARINKPDYLKNITDIKTQVCKECTLCEHCWQDKKEATVTAITDITSAVKQGKENLSSSVSAEFRNRCLRLDEVAVFAKKNFNEYAARLAAENRIDEVRGVVSDQFDSVANMLNDLVNEFDNDDRFDTVTAGRISQALKDIGIYASECICRTDKFGRITVEAVASDNGFGIINKLQIMKIAGSVAEREFDAPTITRTGGEIIIKMSQRARFSAEIGVEQIICSGSSMCGDSYNYFYDGKGRLIFVLSDGMGCGGRAAVDSAMATGLISRLINAGFGFDCSLRILNSSMLFKSTDESLTTVDVTSLDLFTGDTQLLKAGAAPTLVRRSGRTGKAQSTSLPIGILRDIAFDKANITLSAGDILLMLSDGATNDGIDWICEELEKWSLGSAQQLSEHIAKLAKERRSDNHEDDITVIAAIIERA